MPVARTRSGKSMAGHVNNPGAQDDARNVTAQHNGMRQGTQLKGGKTLDTRKKDTKDRKEAIKQARELLTTEEDQAIERLDAVEADVERLFANDLSFENYKEKSETQHTTLEIKITKVQQDLNDLPTSKHVESLVNNESKARADVLNTITGEFPATVNKTITTRLEQFQETVLDTFVDNKLVSTTQRIDVVERLIHTSQNTLSGLTLQMKDYPGAERLKVWHSEVRKSLDNMSERLSSKFNTLLETKIKQCASSLRESTIPQALDPLVEMIRDIGSRVDSVNATIHDICKAEEACRKKEIEHRKVVESRLTKLTDLIHDLKQSHQESQEQLQRDIVSLQKDMVEKSQTITELETAGADLRKELEAEQEGRKKVEERQKRIEQDIIATNASQSTLDAKMIRLLAQTTATGPNQDTIGRKFQTQLQQSTDAMAELVNNLHTKIDQQKNDIVQQLHSKNDAVTADFCIRVEKLEMATSKIPADLSPEVIKLGAELDAVRKTVNGLDLVSGNASKKLDMIVPMLADIDALKDQHKDHLIDCKAQIERSLESRIRGQNPIQEHRVHVDGAVETLAPPTSSTDDRTIVRVPKDDKALAIQIRGIVDLLGQMQARSR